MFKRKTGKLLTGICSTALAFSMVFTTAPMTFASSGEDSGTKTVEYAQTETFFDSGYDSATTNGNYHNSFTTYNCDMYPRVLDEKNVIGCIKSAADFGYLYLGAEYTNKDEVIRNSMTVQEGEEYTIEFKYKLTDVSNGGAKNSNFQLGICTTVPAGQTIGSTENQWGNNIYCKNPKVILNNSNSATATDGWVNCKVNYTVGAIEQTSETAGNPDVSIDKLAIYTKLYHGRGVYIDDVKVTQTKKYKGDVLVDEDFSNATERSDPWGTGDSCGGCWPVLSTVDDTNNKVIRHVPGFWGHGVIPVGAPMTGNAQNSAAAITAEAGATYRIEFDYYLSGTNNNSAYEVGLEVGKVSGQATNQGPAYSFRQSILSFPQNTTFEGKWKRASANITIPNGTVFSNGDKLMIYFLNGHGSDVLYYYDNLTVIKITSEKSVVDSDTVIYDTDFSDATVRSDRSQGDAFGDAYPVIDPIDSSKKAVFYNGGWYNNGIIFIGSKMTTAAEAQSSAISAKAGATYKVEFSYYITGQLRATTNPVIIGICARSTTGNAGDNRAQYSFRKELVLENQTEEFNMDGYKTVSAVVTIPENTDFSNYGDKLGIYMRGQDNTNCETRFGIYIGSIKVTEFAPVSVKFVVNGESEYKVFGGNNISYSTAANKSMLWYTDKARTQSFGFDFYDNAGKLDSITVYGEEVKSDVPLIKGDVNCDGAFSSEDLVSMRKVLLGAETVSSDYHADVTSDGVLNLIDLVRIKKTMANAVPTAYKINGNAVSNYKIVYAENLGSDVAENKNVLEYVNSLAALTGINAAADSEAATEYEIIIGNANRAGVTVDLAENSYIVKAEGNKLYVNGGSVNALIAAIKTLIGHINTGKEINDTYFVDFEYSGGDFPTTLSLAFSEDFSTDFTGAIDNYNNEATASYRDNWTQTYYTDLSNTTTKAENGNLVLYGESYTAEDGSTAYRGGEVNTANYYNYGYFEIRAKVNASNGICPAFWLCGSRDSDSKIEYEIDVFECFGKEPNYLKSTLLAHNYPNGSTGEKGTTETGFTYEQLTEIVAEKGQTYFYNENGWGDEYHTFGLDWQYDSITWYIDGKAVLRATPSNAANGQYVYNEPMRVRLTCYAGRALGGTIDETTDWENGNSLIVDYLKIYQYN